MKIIKNKIKKAKIILLMHLIILPLICKKLVITRL